MTECSAADGAPLDEELINELVDEAEQPFQDRLAWEESLARRVADIRTGRRKTFSLDEVERELGLEHEPIDASVLDEIE